MREWGVKQGKKKSQPKDAFIIKWVTVVQVRCLIKRASELSLQDKRGRYLNVGFQPPYIKCGPTTINFQSFYA